MLDIIKADFKFHLMSELKNTTSLDIVTDVARHFYLTHKDAATELQEEVVECLVKSVGSLNNPDEFEQLLMDAPEFAVDLVYALAQALSSERDKKPVRSTGGWGCGWGGQ